MNSMCCLMTAEVRLYMEWVLFSHDLNKAFRCDDAILGDYSINACLLSRVAQLGLLRCFSNSWLAPASMTDQWIQFQTIGLFMEVFIKRRLNRFSVLHAKCWKTQSDCEDVKSSNNKDFLKINYFLLINNSKKERGCLAGLPSKWVWNQVSCHSHA